MLRYETRQRMQGHVRGALVFVCVCNYEPGARDPQIYNGREVQRRYTVVRNVSAGGLHGDKGIPRYLPGRCVIWKSQRRCQSCLKYTWSPPIKQAAIQAQESQLCKTPRRQGSRVARALSRLALVRATPPHLPHRQPSSTHPVMCFVEGISGLANRHLAYQ